MAEEFNFFRPWKRLPMYEVDSSTRVPQQNINNRGSILPVSLSDWLGIAEYIHVGKFAKSFISK